jgi:hypothetical protein
MRRWTIQPDQLPSDQRHSISLAATDFGPQLFTMMDIFEETPGDELLMIFNHRPYSSCAVQIYDRAGNDLLFQFWHDGHLELPYWMSEARKLVFTGYNSTSNWEARIGGASAAGSAPRVVFAVTPEYGTVYTEYLATPDLPGVPTPSWYRCLLPPDWMDVFHMITLAPPERRISPGRSALIQVSLTMREGAKVTWQIDDQGTEIVGTRVVTDRYRACMNETDLEIETYELGPLPPILGAHEPDGAYVEPGE